MKQAKLEQILSVNCPLEPNKKREAVISEFSRL